MDQQLEVVDEYMHAFPTPTNYSFFSGAGGSSLDLAASPASSSFTCSATPATTFSARSSLSLPSFSSSTSTNPLAHAAAAASSSPHWAALRACRALSPDGLLRLRHFTLLRPLGHGHTARVFLCKLNDDSSSPLFAMKVVDLRDDARHLHAMAEARVLSALDHPFLPTLYARLDAGHYACFLLDFCAGGDLHSLLRRHPHGRLPLPAVRFYAAEVLLAMEYLHALGFVYRDLKPENVLLRADGHVVLSDFDLALPAPVDPLLRRRHLRKHHRHHRRHCRKLLKKLYYCLGSNSPSSSKDEEEVVEFVAEPKAAYSTDCVGTHEYLAPEVVAGGGHGNAVDWWAFGVFLCELAFGRTPFKGATKEATLKNVLHKEVRYPDIATGDEDDDMAKLKDLIGRLLERDPRRRMGAARGAAEIKRHPFFAGVGWALLRCVTPPVVAAAAGEEEAASGPKGYKLGTWNHLGGVAKKGSRGGSGNVIKKKGVLGKLARMRRVCGFGGSKRKW